MKEKNSQPRILYPEIITFQNEGEIKKNILRGRKLMEFVCSKSTLKEMPSDQRERIVKGNLHLQK